MNCKDFSAAGRPGSSAPDKKGGCVGVCEAAGLLLFPSAGESTCCIFRHFKSVVNSET